MRGGEGEGEGEMWEGEGREGEGGEAGREEWKDGGRGTNWFSISRRREQRERVKRVRQEIKIYFSHYLPPSTFLSSPLFFLSPPPQRREKGKMREHKLQNVQTALNFLQNEKKVSSPDNILALTQG